MTSLPRIAALVFALLASAALAAPDEEALGKSQGYPICKGSLRIETSCLVGMVSRFDEVYPARKVPKGAETRPLKRAAAEPAIRFTSFRNTASDLEDYLARNRTTGLLVLRDDTILVERYQYERKPEHRMTSYSMAKTVVAMLVGIAVAEGWIKSIADRADAYVPELKGAPYGETSIRDLLTMSSGVKFTEEYTGNDDVAILARLSIFGGSAGGPATVEPFRTRERPPGEKFHYSSAETQVLGLVLRAATGKTVADYLSERIWQPMGAEADASWTIDKGGYETTYIGVNATLRDWARLGMLLANDGALDGKQIIPADWVRAATTAPARQFEPFRATSYFGYGYQTWLLPGNERQFALRGLRGQFLYVYPAKKLVMVHTGARETRGDPGYQESTMLWIGVVDSLAR